MSLDPLTLAIRYAAFAAVAMAVNLATQWLTMALWPLPLALYAAMVAGTGTGLVAKYLLDKRWIFYDFERSLAGHTAKFSLYSLMGVATTAIFWGTEIAFDAFSDDPRAPYVGAALGLTIGYITKYRLDRRFVFRRAAA